MKDSERGRERGWERRDPFHASSYGERIAELRNTIVLILGKSLKLPGSCLWTSLVVGLGEAINWVHFEFMKFRTNESGIKDGKSSCPDRTWPFPCK